MKSIALLLFLALPLAGLAQTFRTDDAEFRLVKVVEGLEYPWSLSFLPDGRMLVTEKDGRLRSITGGKLDAQPIEGPPRSERYGQGGLLEVAVHPSFSQNSFVYISYTARAADGVGTELARARLVGNRLEGLQVLFRQNPKGHAGQHFGGRIVFDRDGYLYLTLGDRGERERAQLPGDHAGSVIRLHDDGRVPKDNPFVKKPEWKPEKFTLGNRNMQGAALHPMTGELWTHEHGPQGGDEVNIIRAGVNYGWPVITYGRNYGVGTKIGEGTEKEGMAQPLHKWVPSIAPSGMAFYTGDKFPRWRGNVFIGALRDRMLVRLVVDGKQVLKEERLLKNAIGRIRDVRTGPDGFLYLLNDDSDAALYRLEPAG